MVGGAVVLAYNLAGVDKLVLPTKVIAGIYANTITMWNDPAIIAANPGVTLPAATIAAFHRSDSSGTTDNFTKYLKTAAASNWTYDSGKEWAAPGGQGAKGSDGMANAVAATANSIAYMELSFAQNAKLAVASVDNGGGAIVPSPETAAATISSATVTGTGNDLSLSIDYTTTTGYPIVLVTYEITCEKGGDPANVPLTKAFLTYTSSDEGQGKLTAIGYVPITGDLLTKVRTSVSSISG
jgi:phosphate transport system substrate-binding protein